MLRLVIVSNILQPSSVFSNKALTYFLLVQPLEALHNVLVHGLYQSTHGCQGRQKHVFNVAKLKFGLRGVDLGVQSGTNWQLFFNS